MYLLKCKTSFVKGACNNIIKDFEQFDHERLTFELYLDVRDGGTWTVDLIKLYFSASFQDAMRQSYVNSTLRENQFKKMSNYMICTHKDWMTGQPYETLIYSGQASYKFKCTYRKIKNPEVALEKIQGQVSQ